MAKYGCVNSGQRSGNSLIKIKLTFSQASLVLLILLVVFGLFISQDGKFDEYVVPPPTSLIGFDQTKQRAFQATATQDGFHQYASNISLIPNTNYRIWYDVGHLPKDTVAVTTDFYAPGYDNPEQEFTKVFGMEVLMKRQDFTFNSGQSPKSALLRVFYSGPPGLEVENVQITRIPRWLTWLKFGLIFALLSTLLIVVAFAARRFWTFLTLSQQSESTALRNLIGEAPTLVAIYFGAVIIRYAMYISMPYWSGDEYVYKSIAAGIWSFDRIGMLTDDMVGNSVNLPNLLYPYLISPAFALGENFYTAVRLINAMVMNLAIFPCYLIARKLLNQKQALFASILSISIPFVNFGAFAVTEVLFFPLFLLSIWVAIESMDRPDSVKWIAAYGVMAAILMNVRLTALVLIPAYLASIFWISIRRQQGWTLLKRPTWLVTIIAFACTHIFLQYVLGVNRIGGLGLYNQMVPRSDGPFAVVARDPIGDLNLIAGHLATLSIPYALIIALIIFAVTSNPSKLASNHKIETFLVTTTTFAFVLVLLALAFTVSVSPTDLGGLGRWHSRYYFYFYPLIIIAGFYFTENLQPTKLTGRLPVIAIVGILLAANIYFIEFHGGLNNPWFGSIADNMDVQWYRPVGIFYGIFVAFTLLLTWLWYCQSTYFPRVLAGFAILWVLVANYGTLKVTKAGEGGDTFSCGRLGQNFLSQHPGRFAIAGDSRATMVDAAFWNSFIPERTFLHADSKAIEITEIPMSVDYLIANGEIHVDAAYRRLVSIGKCSIYELPDRR